MKCFLPHRSDRMPVTGVKKVRNKEKMEKINGKYGG